MKTEIKLNQFFENELKSDLKEVLISKDQRGRYYLFGKYTIVPTKRGLYRVFAKDIDIEFENMRNAAAWCTLHHAKKYREARRIEDLDLRLSSIDTDLLVHRHMLKKRNDSSKWIYMNKIQEDTVKRRRILDEIKSYINSSKIIQTGKFNNQSNFRFL
jgi:hypothetical protein